MGDLGYLGHLGGKQSNLAIKLIKVGVFSTLIYLAILGSRCVFDLSMETCQEVKCFLKSGAMNLMIYLVSWGV